MYAEEFLSSFEFGKNPEIIGYPVDPELAVQREQVTRAYENARRMAEAGYPAEQINKIADRLNEINGVEVLSEADFVNHHPYRCAEWTFGTIHKEPWALKGFTAEHAPKLWEDPVNFLREEAYEFTDSAQPGDIVAYGDTLFDGTLWLEHFGIYYGDAAGQELVFSKFGQGPLVRHPISLVSTVWGGYYCFLKKSSGENSPLSRAVSVA
jgi:hypothetical protein